MQQYFEYSPEVEQAMRDKKPVLALESTLITHGFPYPHNLDIAKAAEDIARQNGAVPATIAIIQGKVKIGLSTTELELLVHDKYAIKASTRDIPFALSESLTAGTTIAATLFCADYAGIKIFATGGIGGVHRGETTDISSDLVELARTPVACVCSGAKAILDIPRTLEFLETFSVPVLGYRTETFPAYYTAQTHYKINNRLDSIPSIVKYLKTYWQLGLTSSILIANPIPLEDEIPLDLIEPTIIEALRVADEKNIRGKEITPFLLSEVANATAGRSMVANMKLIKNNIQLGAQIASALANI